MSQSSGFRPGSFEFVVGIDKLGKKLMKRLINGSRVKSVVICCFHFGGIN